jgi:hypothetical protein
VLHAQTVALRCGRSRSVLVTFMLRA